MSLNLTQLQTYLAQMAAGPLNVVPQIESLLIECWDELTNSEEGGMQAYKLNERMEKVEWSPPELTFQIERHGGAAQGSSRAELQQWTIDMVQGTAKMSQYGFRQLRPMAPRLDVKAIAKDIADLIADRQNDERIKWLDDGRVRVEIGKVIPDGTVANQTVASRRKRFRRELAKLLGPHGWVVPNGTNTYARQTTHG